jgi:hypothetical protein
VGIALESKDSKGVERINVAIGVIWNSIIRKIASIKKFNIIIIKNRNSNKTKVAIKISI